MVDLRLLMTSHSLTPEVAMTGRGQGALENEEEEGKEEVKGEEEEKRKRRSERQI